MLMLIIKILSSFIESCLLISELLDDLPSSLHVEGPHLLGVGDDL